MLNGYGPILNSVQNDDMQVDRKVGQKMLIKHLAIDLICLACILAFAVPLFSVRCSVDTSTGSVPAAFLVCSARWPR